MKPVVVSSTLAMSLFLFGCAQKPNALNVETIGNDPALAAAILLSQKPEVIAITGEGPRFVEALDFGSDMSSSVPLLGKSKDVIGRAFLFEGEDGQARLYVDLERRNRQPWQVTAWDVTEVSGE